MQKTQNVRLRKSTLASAMAAAIGMTATPSLHADIYQWGSTTPDLVGATTASINLLPDYTTICADSTDAASVVFTMLSTSGQVIPNSSIQGKASFKYQTTTCGTFKYDTLSDTDPGTGIGTATIAPFQLFNGNPTLPSLATGILVDKVPSAKAGGDGNMLMANMLFDWNSSSGIPVSLIWDAQGILGEMDGSPTSFTLNADGSINAAIPFSNTGAIPASDGTYTDFMFGYLNLGPQPLATQSFDITSVLGVDGSGNTVCVFGDGDYSNNTGGGCMGVIPSGDITKNLIVDDTPNFNDFDLTTPTYSDLANDGVSGNPMVDGPFTGFNASFEFNNMKLVAFTDTTPPVITLLGDNPLVLEQGSPYIEPGVACTDAPPLDAFDIPVVPPPGTDTPPVVGNYIVNYSCTDGSGNTAVASRQVIVVPAAPVIRLVGDASIVIKTNMAYEELGMLVTDAQDGDITVPITSTGACGAGMYCSVDNSDVKRKPGTYVVTYNVTDSDGNVATQVTRTVVVETPGQQVRNSE